MANAHGTPPLLRALVELPKGWRPGTTQVRLSLSEPYFYWIIPQSLTHTTIGFIASVHRPFLM